MDELDFQKILESVGGSLAPSAFMGWLVWFIFTKFLPKILTDNDAHVKDVVLSFKEEMKEERDSRNKELEREREFRKLENEMMRNGLKDSLDKVMSNNDLRRWQDIVNTLRPENRGQGPGEKQ